MTVSSPQHQALLLLSDLIRFPSLSHQEGPIADFLADYITGRGLAVQRHRDNLYFALGEGSERLLLNSHLDVVPPSAGHPFEPYEPTVEDGYVYGRGAVDAKASVASMIVSVLELAENGWSPENGQVLVALTACEEMGKGYNGLEDLLPHLPEIRAALVGEPTDLRPCTSQKGLLILNIRATGRAAHAARASLGENAIVKAADDIRRLVEIRLDRDDPLLGPVTVTPTIVSGGTAKNTVPEECTFTVDIRSTPAYSHDELVVIVRNALESDVQIHSDRLVPVRTSLEERIVRAAVAATGEEPFGSPTMSDWIFLSGTPTVKMGPGSSDLSHTSNERISMDEVTRAVAVYKDVIIRYFSPEDGGPVRN